MGSMVDFATIRSQFPILNQQIHGHPLVYLDSAATAQKPECVIDAEAEFYRTINAGVHRGAHELAARSTVAFEEARAKVAGLVGAHSEEGHEEVVVTAGATAALNLLATAFSNASLGRGGAAAKRFALKPGDEIVVSKADHHSVLLPFQELAYRTGATLRWFDLDQEGRVLSDTADEVITNRTKLVAIAHIANVTGAITDIAPIVKRAHEVGALMILDACQSVPHIPVDFHALDVDFAAWSAHKMYGPTGVAFFTAGVNCLKRCRQLVLVVQWSIWHISINPQNTACHLHDSKQGRSPLPKWSLRVWRLIGFDPLVWSMLPRMRAQSLRNC